ncbi:hypothetical protein B0H19DRAFT_1175344, partial [Mycena capillaripes]
FQVQHLHWDHTQHLQYHPFQCSVHHHPQWQGRVGKALPLCNSTVSASVKFHTRHRTDQENVVLQ